LQDHPRNKRQKLAEIAVAYRYDGLPLLKPGDQMKRSSLSFVAGAIVAAAGTTAILNHPVARAEPPSVPDGFTVNEMRFDETGGDRKLMPSIPRGWRFVAVSNGERENGNNLWFQDQTGNIFLVHGFMTAGVFSIDMPIGELHAPEH
jgi:hypothetical protein